MYTTIQVFIMLTKAALIWSKLLIYNYNILYNENNCFQY